MSVQGYPGVDAQKAGEHQPAHQAKGDPWPWPQNADPVLQAEREAKAGSGQLPAPHGDAIDHEAYRQFMRGLG